MGIELAEQVKEAGIIGGEVLVPCGGGGLTSGIALALEKTAPTFVVRPCEPEHYDDTARSLAAGYQVANHDSPPSICDAIVTAKPGDITFPHIRRLCGAGLVVTEDQVRGAIREALTHLKLVIEPGGAVALAAALYQPQAFKGDDIVVIVSGGNVDLASLREIL